MLRELPVFSACTRPTTALRVALMLCLVFIMANYGFQKTGHGADTHSFSQLGEIHASADDNSTHGCGGSGIAGSGSSCCAGISCQILGIMPQPALVYLAADLAITPATIAGAIMRHSLPTFHPPKSSVQA